MKETGVKKSVSEFNPLGREDMLKNGCFVRFDATAL